MIFCEQDCSIFEQIEAKINADLKEPRIELVFVDNKQMQALNKNTRSKDENTDVLSFPLHQIGPKPMLGSIVINKELAKTISKQLNHSLEAELCLLFIHALLHLRGYDHEIDDGLMYEKEREYIKEFKLPSSLIDRNKN